MDISSTSNPTLSDTVLSNLGTTFDEQLVISTLLGLSEGEKYLSERSGLPQEKGEIVCERPLIFSELAK